MGLQEVWFVLIAVLFIGYFVLEGFDFGVGMLMPVARQAQGPDGDTRRRVVLNTIGPVWDGNEVWLITAGGAMFAAFPEWYATLVLRLLSAAADHPGRADRADLRHRIPRQDRRRHLAQAVRLGHRLRFLGAGRAVGRGVREHRAGRRRSTPTSRSPRASSICSTRTRCSAV